MKFVHTNLAYHFLAFGHPWHDHTADEQDAKIFLNTHCGNTCDLMAEAFRALFAIFITTIFATVVLMIFVLPVFVAIAAYLIEGTSPLLAIDSVVWIGLCMTLIIIFGAIVFLAAVYWKNISPWTTNGKVADVFAAITEKTCRKLEW
jgi:hypothetical protein